MNEIPCPVPNHSLTLVLHAAEGPLQICLADHAQRLRYAAAIDAPSRGTEVLTPAIHGALALLGESVRDIARIAVVRGPGSFTGIRLALTTAAGLARAVGAQQAGLDALYCLAKECLPLLRPALPGTQLWILTRARRDLLYAQPFVCDTETGLHALESLAVLPVADGRAGAHILKTALAHTAPHILLAGSGARDHADTLPAHLHAVPTTVLDILAPRPETLLDAAYAASYGDADIVPFYVRPSDAEENLPQIAGKLGLDPDMAVAELYRLTHTRPGPDTGA